MAKRESWLPAWTWTLDAMIAEGRPVRVWCDGCKAYRNIEGELVALREIVGGSYSLVNRRCRCRLTVGCSGWNTIHYLQGVYRALRDLETRERWIVTGKGRFLREIS